MKKIWLMCLLLVFGCHSNLLTEKDNGQVVTFNTGEEFVLELPENATTGYRWNIKTDPELQFIISQTSDNFEVKNSKLIGAGGKRSIRFTASGQGTVKLLGFHRRPWEANASDPRPDLEIDIVVK